jgi:rhodanese-related sulfurtransferase
MERMPLARRRACAWAVLLVAAAGILAGCGLGPGRISDANIRDLGHVDLMAMLDAPGQALPRLVDVRPSRYYEKGRLPGAIHIFLPDLQADDPRLQNVPAIVVYAQTWQDNLGPAAVKQLIALGYDNVWLYRGGVELWIARGGQLEGGQ